MSWAPHCHARKGMVCWDAWVVAKALAVAGKLQLETACLSTSAIEAAVLATQASNEEPLGSVRRFLNGAGANGACEYQFC